MCIHAAAYYFVLPGFKSDFEFSWNCILNGFGKIEKK